MSNFSESNTTPTRRTCATSIMNHRLLELPEYRARRARIERFARAAKAPSGIIDISVVVHIVMQDLSVISDAQVYNQIQVLNEDFQGLNSDLAQVPAPFQPAVGNPQIRFTLASVDPNGNPTTGITRTRALIEIFSSCNEGVKSVARGGVDPWDTTRYLNIWVCAVDDPIAGPLLGYAQFPGGPPETDGVVLSSSAFGRGFASNNPRFNLGRTATHECGHYFDVRHIWGDRVGCLGDDLVADTPQHEDANEGTPTFPRITCSNAPDGEMFMNYMDYVDDVAMFMFTKGQVDRMRVSLAGPRVGLIPPQSAIAPSFRSMAREAAF
ncbi:MAG TPA: zinc metalloprotease [Thermoanaerobaculia bacterium]|nr:zinc metalloprotease [Thermoanaerobaculia bacterium]